jgi:hypothetical protein
VLVETQIESLFRSRLHTKRVTCLKKIKILFTNQLLTMFTNSGPFTDIKFTPDSFAIAFANKVLPHPGGPTNKTPGGLSAKSSQFF